MNFAIGRAWTTKVLAPSRDRASLMRFSVLPRVSGCKRCGPFHWSLSRYLSLYSAAQTGGGLLDAAALAAEQGDPAALRQYILTVKDATAVGGNSAKRRAALDVGRTYAPNHILANATAEIKQGMRQCSHVLRLPAELSLASLTLQAAHLRAFPLLSPHTCTRLREHDAEALSLLGGNVVHGDRLKLKGSNPNRGSRMKVWEQHAPAEEDALAGSFVATEQEHAALLAVVSYIAEQVGRPAAELKSASLGLSYPGQAPQCEHKDSRKRYLNVIGSAQDSAIEGTHVTGVPCVRLEPMEWQFFWSNSYHRQPPPLTDSVRRTIFMSFAVAGGVDGRPIYRPRPPKRKRTN